MMKTDRSVIIIGGNTAAIRAQRLLGNFGIKSKVTRSTSSYGGCVYGLEIENYSLNEAIYILRRNGTAYQLL